MPGFWKRDQRQSVVYSWHEHRNRSLGGGIDTRAILHVSKIPIGFRVEVRDFYSGSPNHNRAVNGSQNNVVFTVVC
jgi:hypothetical protein